ncbi:MAG: XTP/dITP diphosphatase [Chloroflexota bacterium]
MKKLLVATKNKGKIKEFAEMLADLQVEWLSLDDVDITFDVEETGTTFRENALLKAEAYAKASGLLTIADDSGLVVDVLDGAPGVYTARYGGAGLTAVQRYQHLLKNIETVTGDSRTARFRCVILFVDSEGNLLAESDGVCEGMIATEPAGEGGFGYDPVFYLPEHDKTMAQLPSETKHQISHRGRALQQLVPKMREILSH